MDRDWTAEVLDRWATLSPKLDIESSEVVERIGRIALQFGRWHDEVFGRHGLNRGEVGVLYALRGVATPQRLSPTQLSRALMLSSAGITSRLDRLERRHLVARRTDPDDRRGILVELTEQGSKAADEAVVAGAEASARMVSSLSRDELKTLGRLLRKLQAGLEPAGGPGIG
ncbi:MAG: MarR family winged helix-turn-helix transcriptional regulator [Candidatus Dormibacteraceae bacterium]